MAKITLRKVEEKDWDFLVQIRNEPVVRNACKNTSYFTKDEYKKYINEQLKQNSFNRHWIILYDGEIAGHTKVINQQFGYIIDKKFRNKGLAKEIMDRVFEKVKAMGISKVYDIIKVNQPIPLWLAIKNGFKMTGIISDEDKKPYAYKLEKLI